MVGSHILSEVSVSGWRVEMNSKDILNGEQGSGICEFLTWSLSQSTLEASLSAPTPHLGDSPAQGALHLYQDT